MKATPTLDTLMRFSGMSQDRTAYGYFPVRVIAWDFVPHGVDAYWASRVPIALVRNIRTGRIFSAYQHTLRREVSR